MGDIVGVHHIALTVSDLERSARWYTDVFGLSTLADFDEAEGERHKVILRHPETGLRIGLVSHRRRLTGAFDETHVGLDHLSFAVGSRAELDALQQRLERMGVQHSPITEGLGSLVLVFRDPDNIQLELVTSQTP